MIKYFPIKYDISFCGHYIIALAENADIIVDPIIDIDSDFIAEPENYLNCSYSEADESCPSGFAVCTGHTDDEECTDKKPELCFNLVQCQYDTNAGSTCTCSE